MIADSTSDLEIVAAAVPGGSEYSITAPTARHTGALEEPGSGCLSTERPPGVHGSAFLHLLSIVLLLPSVSHLTLIDTL